jgi:hypothetical protein
MRTIKVLILGLGILFISSCNKDNETAATAETKFLIFGHFYGECIGESCVQTYKLTDTKLYVDLAKNYNGNDLNFQKMDESKFNQVANLKADFPIQLLDETESVIGCPDCRDQGGIFIQYSNNGIIKSWRIDNDKTAIPTYLHPFMEKVNDKIHLLTK